MEENENAQNMQNGAEGSGEAKAARRSTPGSIAFVPSVAGLIAAGEVIKDLIKNG